MNPYNFTSGPSETSSTSGGAFMPTTGGIHFGVKQSTQWETIALYAVIGVLLYAVVK